MDSAETEYIRARTLQALARTRVPGYHFPGHFLELHSLRYGTGGVEFEMAAGAHCTDPDGTVNLGAVAFLADMALASSARAFVDPTARTATLTLQLRFTGVEARGPLRAQAHSGGFSRRTALAEAWCAGSVSAGGKEVLYMSGTWVAPPAPGGQVLHPLPWESKSSAVTPALALKELDDLEKIVVRRVERALRASRDGDFLRQLWAPKVRRTGRGAASRLPVSMHIGNRVGHVQGGLLLNAALVTAVAAVPQHPLLTAVSSWYISPGQGKAVSARSTILQTGRNVAVVRTELFAAGGKRVLEAVSNHAVAGSG